MNAFISLFPPKRTSAQRQLRRIAPLLLSCNLAALSPTALQAAADGDITSVSARVSNDYVRAKFPNGSYQTETYAFARGGHWSGSLRDNPIDHLQFTEIARTISRPLASQNYLPANTPNQTKLLIMVYWGTTTGTSAASSSIAYQALQSSQASSDAEQDSALLRVQLENEQRDQTDVRNSRMLGYDSEGLIGTDYGRHLLTTALHHKTDDLINEIEDNRYFVVLMAYDFQLMWKQKKHKLLWETRFSIRESHNDFAKVLPEITQYASRYFGQDSHGLIRKPLQENVVLGELKILGVESEKK